MIQHFGFWPGSVSPFESIWEHAGYCNVTKAIWVEPRHTPENVRDMFGQARAAGLAVIMNFPEGDDRLQLDEWAEKIKPYAGDILAFFLRDEPDCVSGGNPAQLASTLAEIEGWIQRLHRHFPAHRMMLTLGCFNELLPRIGFRLPAGITDVALECYHGWTQWKAWLDRLTPYLTAEHRVWLMPYAYGASAVPGLYQPRTEAEMIYEAQRIYDYAKTDSRVVGLLPFAWYDGVRELPTVRAYFERIGREIVEQRIPAPTTTMLRMLDVIPREVMAGRSFRIAVIGDNLAPTASVQYSAGNGFVDYPVTRLAENVLTLSGPPVPAGRYAVRLRNPDGEATPPVTVEVV